ncbi:MAG TPA: DegV family protein, partial [Alphaproteobacteria bacterium]|nr:DegV family protein [Alphaproteobacteria bacterium]
VTDSTADIPGDLASELGVSVVPCQVAFGKEAYRDGIDLTPGEFFQKMAESDQVLRTSGPIVNDFVETYQRLLAEDGVGQILSIHVAGTLSGTLNSAWAAVQTLPDPERVQLVDSGQVSMGLGWIVIHAARVAQQGAALAEVAAATRAMIPRVRVAAMVDTLDNLYRGGRISVISAALGSVLEIKPLLSIGGGDVTVWGKVRTRSRALRALVSRVQEWGALEDVAVLHIGAPVLLEELRARLTGILPGQEMIVAPAGSALSSHLGLGTVGVCAVQAAET